jgi:hypothetical protein
MFLRWENVFMPTATMLHLEVPDLQGISGASDGELIETMRAWAQARRVVDAGLATLAAVVAARSSLELGYGGLAQRAGARTADGLVSRLTGTSAVEARAITTVGTMMSAPAPWLGEVATRVVADPAVRRDDETGRAARPGIGGTRHRCRRRGHLTPARRTRFVDPGAVARAEAIVNDGRSTEQLTLDALVQMVRIATAADQGRVFGVRVPAVRVHVTLTDLDRRTGTAHLEGQTAAISVATAHRIACADGLVPILFDDHGKPLKLGHTKRRSPNTNAPSLPPSGADAPTPAATGHRPGPKPTTSTNESATTEEPTSTAASFCANTTTS